MNALKALATLVKVWFLTVNQYRKLKAQCALRKYEKTLSPKQREHARHLRYRLAAAKKPGEAAQILIAESRRLGEMQMRLIERIDRASNRELTDVEDRLKVVQDATANRA
jgi:erythromycin esterase-like protein